ncbi:MAG TPA: hypothetical protein VJ826_11585 [Candidatus Polarisedimenticolaceae bacterium]|nr:hypothetical protein [Candidatus Polarisedimenticolaceae bacterium]
MKMTVRVGAAAVLLAAFTGFAMAEDAKATSSTRPPKNLKLVGDHWTPWDPPAQPAEGAYIIQRGDNFWDLSGKWLGDPYLWPQVWDQNRYVLDSHWIYPGDPLNIPARPQVVPPEGPPAGENQAPTETETAETTPEPSAAPARPASSTTPSMIQLADRHDLYCSGSIDDDHQASSLVVVAGELEKDMQADEDILYLNQGRNNGIQSGAEYLVVRAEHHAIHPATREALGTYMQRLGHIRVLCAQDDTAIAVVLDACTDLKPGDEVIPWPNLASPILERVPPVDRCQEPSGLAQGYVVDGGADQPTVYGSGHVVHADLGQEAGVRPGSILTVYRDNGDLPRIVLGEAVVLTVDGATSTIKMLQSTREARWGDRVEILQQ